MATGITILVAAFLFALIARDAAWPGKINGDTRILRYYGLLRGTAVLLMLTCLWLTDFKIGQEWPGNEGKVLATSLFFLMGPASFCLETFGVRISFDSNGIRALSPWRRSREIPWLDVASIRYSKTWNAYEIGTRSNGTVRVPELLSGIKPLLQEMAKQNPDLMV